MEVTSSQIDFNMKKQKTFADRAKEIKKKYPRAEWDKIERKDMMKELEELREEQEEYKTAIGIAEDADAQDAEEQEEMKHGGKLKYYAGEGDSWLPKIFNTGKPNYGIAVDNPYGDGLNLMDQGFVPQKVTYDNPNLSVSANKLSNNKLYPMQAQNKLRPVSTSFLPFAISGASSLIGDIAGLANMNRNMPKDISMPRMSTQKISLQPQREALQRSYASASNNILRNSRDVSSPGNAYANQIAGISGLTDSLGNQMGESWMNEANTNAQFAQRANEHNAQMGAREAMMNTELQGQKAQMRGQYINSMAQTVPMMFRDYRQQVNEANMINNMGKDYGMYEQYNPNERPIDRILAQLRGRPTTIRNRMDTTIG